MSAAFLSQDELRQLTGYKSGAWQVRWLERNGVRHWVAVTGRPVVPRSAIDGLPASQDDGALPPPELGDVA